MMMMNDVLMMMTINDVYMNIKMIHSIEKRID